MTWKILNKVNSVTSANDDRVLQILLLNLEFFSQSEPRIPFPEHRKPPQIRGDAIQRLDDDVRDAMPKHSLYSRGKLSRYGVLSW